MSRRMVSIGGWLAFAAALAALHTGQTVRLFAISMMVTTCGGTAVHLARAIRSRGHARRVWALTAAGLGCWAYAEVSVGVPALVTGVAPERGLPANLLNLLALFFAVAAMLIIPAAPRGAVERIRMLLDGVVAAAAALGAAWVLIVGPLIDLEGTRDALVDLAYPVLSTGVLAVALVLLAGMRWRRCGAMTAITGGVLVVALSLLAEMGGELAGRPTPQPWVLDGYLAAAGLLALSGLLPLPRRTDREWRPASTVASLLPFLPMAVFVAVCAGSGVLGRAVEPAVVWAGTVAVCALFARQFLTIRSNVKLTRDLAEQRARFADEARHDPLTGLPNRAVLNRALARAGDDTTLLMIDLDGFKAVNDTLGHAAGDELLMVIADRLRAAIVPYDALACRLGGDEFAVLVQAGGLAPAEDLARTLLDRCAEPMSLDGRTAGVRASIGIALRRPGRLATRLPHEADLALYEAKRGGKGRYHVFDADLAEAVDARRRLEAELATALVEGQFELAYEPVVDLDTGDTLAVAATPYWQHPRLGRLDPAEYGPAVADAGLHAEIDRWTVEAGLDQLRVWRSADPGFRLALSLSGKHLVAADLVPVFAADPEIAAGVSLLITGEGCPVALAPVRALGVRVVLESFDVARMASLPADGIRLSPAFLRGLDDGPEAAALFAAIVARAESVGLVCVSRGVATPEQAGHLRRLGCRLAQGPLYGAPGPAAAITVRTTIGAGGALRR